MNIVEKQVYAGLFFSFVGQKETLIYIKSGKVLIEDFSNYMDEVLGIVSGQGIYYAPFYFNFRSFFFGVPSNIQIKALEDTVYYEIHGVNGFEWIYSNPSIAKIFLAHVVEWETRFGILLAEYVFQTRKIKIENNFDDLSFRNNLGMYHLLVGEKYFQSKQKPLAQKFFQEFLNKPTNSRYNPSVSFVLNRMKDLHMPLFEIKDHNTLLIPKDSFFFIPFESTANNYQILEGKFEIGFLLDQETVSDYLTLPLFENKIEDIFGNIVEYFNNLFVYQASEDSIISIAPFYKGPNTISYYRFREFVKSRLWTILILSSYILIFKEINSPHHIHNRSLVKMFFYNIIYLMSHSPFFKKDNLKSQSVILPISALKLIRTLKIFFPEYFSNMTSQELHKIKGLAIHKNTIHIKMKEYLQHNVVYKSKFNQSVDV